MAKQIGFTERAKDIFNLEGQIASYMHLVTISFLHISQQSVTNFIFSFLIAATRSSQKGHSFRKAIPNLIQSKSSVSTLFVGGDA